MRRLVNPTYFSWEKRIDKKECEVDGKREKMRYELPIGTVLARLFALVTDYRKHPVSGKTSLVGGAGPHGSPRVSTGVSSRRLSASKTAVFHVFTHVFARKKY